jgi:hypothetical protein
MYNILLTMFSLNLFTIIEFPFFFFFGEKKVRGRCVLQNQLLPSTLFPFFFFFSLAIMIIRNFPTIREGTCLENNRLNTDQSFNQSQLHPILHKISLLSSHG